MSQGIENHSYQEFPLNYSTPGKLLLNVNFFLPLIKNYIAISFCIGLFFIYLDGNFRSESLIRFMTITLFLKNLAFVIVFVFLASVVVALIIFFFEFLALFIFSRLFKLSCYIEGSFSLFAFYIMFVYINLIYFKYYIAALFSKPDFTILKRETMCTIILFILSLIIYFIIVRKKSGKDFLRNLSRGYFKIFIAIVSVSLIVSVFTFLVAQKNIQHTVAKQKKPHIILITCDSLASMHMSLYGYTRKTTPHLDELAKESTVFKRMIANSNWTHTSLPCILGRYPRDCNYPSSKTNVTRAPSLTTVLKDNGYRRRIFVSSSILYKSLFTDFTDYVSIRSFERHPLGQILHKGDNRINIQWLSAFLSVRTGFFNILSLEDPRDANLFGDPYLLPLYLDYVTKTLKESDTPVFIWAHLFEPHYPYDAPPQFRYRFGKAMMDLYDGTIAYLDNELNTFIKSLKNTGIYDQSLFLLSADHGQGFGLTAHANIRRWFQGGDTLNDEINNIPLVIHLPKQREGNRPETFAGLIDIAPTVLDLLGVSPEQWMEGESLVSYMNNEKSLSKKIKLVIPVSYFYRKFISLKEKPPMFMCDNADMFNVYWYKYKVGWIEMYSPDSKNRWMINIPACFGYYCIYNAFNDPRETTNLIKETYFKDLLKKIFSSSVVNLYKNGIKEFFVYK